jgi:lipoprotein NlpI/ABC-type multidrug transport system fused ATPase/permease subunit
MSHEHYAKKSVERGRAAYQQGDWQLAISELSRAIDLIPSYAEAYYGRGCAYGESGQYERAIEDYTRVIHLEPSFMPAYRDRGSCHMALENYENAMADCTKALQLESSNKEVYYLRGIISGIIGQIASAIADFSRAIELDPSFIEAYYRRGMACRESGLFTEALEDFTIVIAHNPDMEEVYAERGYVYYELDSDECLADLHEALRRNPNDITSYKILALYFERKWDFSQALFYCTQAAQLGDEEATEQAEVYRRMLRERGEDEHVPKLPEEYVVPATDIQQTQEINGTEATRWQRELVRSLVNFQVQYHKNTEILQTQYTEQRRIADNDFSLVQRRITTVLDQVQSVREKATSRLRELLPDRELTHTSAQSGISYPATASQQDAEHLISKARTHLEMLEKSNKPDLAWIIMGFVPLAFVASLIASFMGLANQVCGGSIVLFVIILVGIFAHGRSWPNQIHATAKALMQNLANAEQWGQQEINMAQQEYQRRLAELDETHTQKTEALRRDYQHQKTQWDASARKFLAKTTPLSPPWADPFWDTWWPPENAASIVRLGVFNTHNQISDCMPAYIDFPGANSLIFQVTGETKAPALAAIQAMILRLMTTMPAGEVLFTFLDPVGQGRNVEIFMQLQSQSNSLSERQLVTKAWSEPQHIEEQLLLMTNHIAEVIQKRLQGHNNSLAEYNAKNPAMAEPYRVVVALDFPVNFRDDAARRLVSIVQNGPRCGVFTIVLADLGKPKPYGFDFADLERGATVITSPDQQHFIISDADYQHTELLLESLPSDRQNKVSSMLKQVQQAALVSQSKAVLFDQIAPNPTIGWDPAIYWDSNWNPEVKNPGDSKNIPFSVPIGLDGRGESHVFEVGRGGSISHHALIAGQTGSGKSTLINTLIMAASLKYRPDELELYLIDFKDGVGFKKYATQQLPHARVIAIDSEREFGLSVLEGLLKEQNERGELFKQYGAEDLNEYRQKTEQALPRILLLVDEFQELFSRDDNLATRVQQILEILVRKGRSFGIHVVLSTQTLRGSGALPGAIKEQMGIRIALKCSNDESRLILSDDNTAAGALSRLGEAIYNADSGSVQGNNPLRVAKISDAEQVALLNTIREQARQLSYHREPLIFDGNQPAHIEKNYNLKQALEEPAPTSPPRKLHAWIGEPIAIRDSIAATFCRQSGKNLLIVGTDEQSALGMITVSIISLAAQIPCTPGARAQTFSVLDFTTEDNDGFFDNLANKVPHTVEVARRKQMPEMINVIAEEVQRRLRDGDISTSPVFFIIHGLHRARDLHQDAPGMDYLSGGLSSVGAELDALDNEQASGNENLGLTNSFDATYGSTSSNTGTVSSNPAQQLPFILREGPEVGVYTIVWCDSMPKLNRAFDLRTQREFLLRVAMQMSESDSHNLIDSSAASKLGWHRALLYDDENATIEKFRPYAVPDQQWLSQANGQRS